MAMPAVDLPQLPPADSDGVDNCSVETSSLDSPVEPPMGSGGLETEEFMGFGFEETCIIFDWDDTLLSSSWLALNSLRLDTPGELPQEAVAQLSILEEAVVTVLTLAMRCGSVAIITNAENGWVELSAKKFLPRVVPLLSKVRVLSARTTYEALYPDSPSDWKVQAFYQEICAAFAGRRPDSHKNVLSFGDSIHERAAIHKVTANMGPLTRTKSIKLVERPTVEQLKRQLDMVISCFEDIWRHQDNLDLMLTIQLLYSS